MVGQSLEPEPCLWPIGWVKEHAPTPRSFQAVAVPHLGRCGPWARLGRGAWIQIERTKHGQKCGGGKPHIRAAAIGPGVTANTLPNIQNTFPCGGPGAIL